MKRVGYVYGLGDKNYTEKQYQALKELNLDTICFEESSKDSKLIPDEVLEEITAVLNEDDELVIYEITCLGKSIIKLGEFLEGLNEKKVRLIVLNKGDLSNDISDSLFVEILLSIYLSEKMVIKERTTRGIEHARREGRVGGRPKISEETIKEIQYLYHQKSLTLREIAETCHVSLGTTYKYIQKDIS